MKLIILFGLVMTANFVSATAPPKLPNNSKFVVDCAIEASILYELPTAVLLAVASKEGGSAGIRVKNNNGTYDIGLMQFNTAYIKTLHKFNINENHLNQKNCYPFKLAAWRIKRHIIYDRGDYWSKISNYHSKTPYYNSIYRSGVIKYAKQWENWLEKTDLNYVKLVIKEQSVTMPLPVQVNPVQQNSDDFILTSTNEQIENSKNNNNFSSKIDISNLNY